MEVGTIFCWFFILLLCLFISVSLFSYCDGGSRSFLGAANRQIDYWFCNRLCSLDFIALHIRFNDFLASSCRPHQ